MSLVVKLIIVLFLISSCSVARARDMYILVVGEGVAANCNVHSSGEVKGVYQIGSDGKIKPAHDPLDWAECTGGSIWIPLGRELIQSGMANKVVFMPLAFSQISAHDMVDGGRGASLIKRGIDVANTSNIKFDYALFQQGISDNGTSAQFYRRDITRLVKEISRGVTVKRWLFAQGSGCSVKSAPHILTVQETVSRNHQYNRYAGPSLTTFGDLHIDHDCSLTESGQASAARLWFDAIQGSDTASDKFEKELLFYYFK
jgi:hypothetical protein